CQGGRPPRWRPGDPGGAVPPDKRFTAWRTWLISHVWACLRGFVPPVRRPGGPGGHVDARPPPAEGAGRPAPGGPARRGPGGRTRNRPFPRTARRAPCAPRGAAATSSVPRERHDPPPAGGTRTAPPHRGDTAVPDPSACPSAAAVETGKDLVGGASIRSRGRSTARAAPGVRPVAGAPPILASAARAGPRSDCRTGCSGRPAAAYRNNRLRQVDIRASS